MKKIIAIAGATASGKSSKALELISKKINSKAFEEIFFKDKKNKEIDLFLSKINFDNDAEIISADSRQIYKNISIFSGISSNEKKVKDDGKIHLLNFKNEDENFSAGEFERIASEKIEEIISKSKIPVIVGGTSFYFKSLFYENFLPKVDINKSLREELNKKNLAELLEELKEKDLKRFKTIDKNNKPRVIRALEIIEKIGFVPENSEKIKDKYEIYFVWIKIDREEQKMKIAKNFIKRIENGFFEEAEKLYEKLKSKKFTEKEIERIFYNLGLSYKFIFQLWRKDINKEKFIELGILEEQKYAKRQNTYLKKFFKELPEKVIKIEI